MSERCKICKCHMMGPETQGNVCNHCLDVRGNMFNRMDGLMALRRAGISKRVEMAGFLAIMHPELSEERIAKLSKELTEEGSER
jgi:hypothetical protein